MYLLQDYHRFHLPVSGIVEQFVDIPGCLYTVCVIITWWKWYIYIYIYNEKIGYMHR